MSTEYVANACTHDVLGVRHSLTVVIIVVIGKLLRDAGLQSLKVTLQRTCRRPFALAETLEHSAAHVQVKPIIIKIRNRSKESVMRLSQQQWQWTDVTSLT